MNNTFKESISPDFKKIIILDIANNHFGDINHGKEIIKTFSNLKYPKGYKIYFKLQFRNLDTFIHNQAPKDSHYIKRFNSTKLKTCCLSLTRSRVMSFWTDQRSSCVDKIELVTLTLWFREPFRNTKRLARLLANCFLMVSLLRVKLWPYSKFGKFCSSWTYGHVVGVDRACFATL